jgi:hypothetical protein
MATALKVNGQKLAPKPTRREFASWLSQVETDHAKRLDKIDETIALLARSNKTIWDNQKELSKSEELLDEQFAVSTRMMITAVNGIISALAPGVNNPAQITSKDVATVFRDWAAFRKRPDYRNFMMEWFLGVALDKLPPPPVAQATKEGDVHAEGDHGNPVAAEVQPQDSGDGKAPDVPEVQKEDGAKARP